MGADSIFGAVADGAWATGTAEGVGFSPAGSNDLVLRSVVSSAQTCLGIERAVSSALCAGGFIEVCAGVGDRSSVGPGTEAGATTSAEDSGTTGPEAVSKSSDSSAPTLLSSGVSISAALQSAAASGASSAGGGETEAIHSIGLAA